MSVAKGCLVDDCVRNGEIEFVKARWQVHGRARRPLPGSWMLTFRTSIAVNIKR